ncbi:MAG: hypothetical protein SH818_14135 [Saprospiraceae bacterium]|nr:hypothetical protein [Saprospiraceae bacterium]
MINALEPLNAEENDLLTQALPLVAILIGKADGNLDVKELELAKKITHIRTFNSPEYLQNFYEQVEAGFDKNLDTYNSSLPGDAQLRSEMISTKLESLNPVLAKLHPKIGSQLYKGFLRFAQEIAKASGGFLGFMAVNPEESKWVSLPMLVPIEYDTDEEE